MRHLVLGAATAASFVLFAGSANADVIVLRGGEVLPKKVAEKVKEAGGVPSREILDESGKSNLELTYKAAKVDGKDVSPAQVVDVFVTNASLNEVFLEGEDRAEQGLWIDAAASFEAAAEELQGLAKQLAAYKHVLCLANVGTAEEDVQAAFTAADAFVAGFPDSYWLPQVQAMRARILMRRGQADEAVKVLQSVASAPEMNARDLFEARYTEVWLTRGVRASPAQFGEVEKAFRALAEAIDKHPKGRQDAPDQRLMTLARVGRYLALQNKAAEAKQVLKPLADATDHKVASHAALAALYVALGDAVHNEARQASEAGKKDDAKALAEAAALHYLRVAELYADGADDSDVFNATQNVAKVFKVLFNLSGDKDCETGSRAYNYYVTAVQMLPEGDERRALVREGMALKESLAKNCGTEEKKPPEKKEDEKPR